MLYMKLDIKFDRNTYFLIPLTKVQELIKVGSRGCYAIMYDVALHSIDIYQQTTIAQIQGW
jgi:hypothetical protein